MNIVYRGEAYANNISKWILREFCMNVNSMRNMYGHEIYASGIHEVSSHIIKKPRLSTIIFAAILTVAKPYGLVMCRRKVW